MVPTTSPSRPVGAGLLPAAPTGAWPWLETLLAGTGTSVAVCDGDGRLLGSTSAAPPAAADARLPGRASAASPLPVGSSLAAALGTAADDLLPAVRATARDGQARRVVVASTAGALRVGVARAVAPAGAPARVVLTFCELPQGRLGDQDGERLDDPRSGLPSEALLVDRLRHALAQSQRDGASLAVLTVETPELSAVLDALGTVRSAELLTAVGARVRGCVRAGDTAARTAADGFRVLVERLASAAPALEVAHRVVDALQSPVLLADGTEVRVRVAVGVAVGGGTDPVPGASAEPADGALPSHAELVRRADLAAQRATAAGSGAVLVFDPHMHDGLLERLRTASELRRALERDELVLHFQPLVELDTGKVSGVEALLRWSHPERGLVPPALFVPLAEETGMIVELGAWVLRRACLAATHELACGGPPVPVAVNVSGAQVRQRLVGDVLDALDRSGLPASALTLEITESALVDADEAATVLQQLRDLGVRIAVDDFGTGYASLAYLSRLPLDVIKVDRSFVASMAGPNPVGSLAEAVVGLGQRLGLEVVAEGIEDAEQLSALQSVGCVLGQGYLFSRPLPSEGLDSVLRAVFPVPALPLPRLAVEV